MGGDGLSMNFCSDNVTGVAPAILAAIQAANHGAAMGYGDDEITARLEARFAALFEADVAVFPVATGTAANALALSAVTPPYGAIYCHELSHINVDECGAPELFSGGAKLIDLPGAAGKLGAAEIAAAIHGAGVVHHPQPAAISVSQVTECGTVYTPHELHAIAEIARGHRLKFHMDGARFANAVASLGCRPADITWRAGVDVLSFGATKNGAMAAEAVLFFDRRLAETFDFRRKRAGHLFSKMRFLSAQLEAYLADDLWLANARHANAMAERLAAGLSATDGIALVHTVQANEIFATLPPAMIEALLADGFKFYRWDGDSGRMVRLVTAFNTDPAAVEAFLAAVRQHAAARPAGRNRAGA